MPRFIDMIALDKLCVTSNPWCGRGCLEIISKTVLLVFVGGLAANKNQQPSF
jgi:hypothetical protein